MSRPNDLTPEQAQADTQLTAALNILQSAIEEAEASGLHVEFKQRIEDRRAIVWLTVHRCTCSA